MSRLNTMPPLLDGFDLLADQKYGQPGKVQQPAPRGPMGPQAPAGTLPNQGPNPPMALASNHPQVAQQPPDSFDVAAASRVAAQQPATAPQWPQEGPQIGSPGQTAYLPMSTPPLALATNHAAEPSRIWGTGGQPVRPSPPLTQGPGLSNATIGPAAPQQSSVQLPSMLSRFAYGAEGVADMMQSASQPTDRPGLLGAAKDILTALPRGMMSAQKAGGGLLQAAGNLTGSETLTDLGRIQAAMGRAGESVYGRSAQQEEQSGFSPRNLASGAVEAIPQLATQVGIAAATGGGSVPAQIAIFAGTAMAPVVGSQYLEAKKYHEDHGASEDEAQKLAAIEAGTAGLITAATNIPIAGVFLRKIPGAQKAIAAAARNITVRAGMGFVAEDLQESSEKVLTDAAASIIRDDPTMLKKIISLDPEYWTSVGLEGVTAGIAGSGVNVATGVGQVMSSPVSSSAQSQETPRSSVSSPAPQTTIPAQSTTPPPAPTPPPTVAAPLTPQATPPVAVQPAPEIPRPVSEPAAPTQTRPSQAPPENDIPRQGRIRSVSENVIKVGGKKVKQQEIGVIDDEGTIYRIQVEGDVSAAMGQTIEIPVGAEVVSRNPILATKQKPAPPSQAPPAKSTPEAGKQPWEMTREDWEKSIGAKRGRRTTSTVAGGSAGVEVGDAGIESPWFTTREEAEGWANQHGASGGQGNVRSETDIHPDGNRTTKWQFVGVGINPHKTAVKKAITEGRPVPAEVLADYPDLSAPPAQPEVAGEGADVAALSYAELRARAKELGLSPVGDRKVLEQRIRDYSATQTRETRETSQADQPVSPESGPTKQSGRQVEPQAESEAIPAVPSEPPGKGSKSKKRWPKGLVNFAESGGTLEQAKTRLDHQVNDAEKLIEKNNANLQQAEGRLAEGKTDQRGVDKMRRLVDDENTKLREGIASIKREFKKAEKFFADRSQPAPRDPNVPNPLLGTDESGKPIAAAQLRLVNREGGAPDATLPAESKPPATDAAKGRPEKRWQSLRPSEKADEAISGFASHGVMRRSSKKYAVVETFPADGRPRSLDERKWIGEYDTEDQAAQAAIDYDISRNPSIPIEIQGSIHALQNLERAREQAWINVDATRDEIRGYFRRMFMARNAGKNDMEAKADSIINVLMKSLPEKDAKPADIQISKSNVRKGIVEYYEQSTDAPVVLKALPFQDNSTDLKAKGEGKKESTVDRLEREARERIAERSKTLAKARKGGKRLGAAPILNDLVDVSIIAAARAYKAGTKAYRGLRDTVAKVVDEIAPHLKDKIGSITTRTRAILQSARERGIDGALEDAAASKAAPKTVRNRAKEQPTVKESKALEATMKGQRRAASRAISVDRAIRKSVASIKRLTRSHILRRLPSDSQQSRVKTLAEEAHKVAERVQTKDVADRVDELRKLIAQHYKDARANYGAYVKARKEELARRRSMLIQSMQDKEPLKVKDVDRDPEVSIFKRAIRSLDNPDTVALSLDGPNAFVPVAQDSFDELKRGHTDARSMQHDITRQVDAAAKAAGYEDWGDALRDISGTLGEVNQSFIPVKLGTRDNLPMGIALAIHLSDPKMVEQLDMGVRIKITDADKSGVAINKEKRQEISDAIPERVKTIGEAMKKVLEEQTRPGMFDTVYRLTGVKPKTENQYWMTHRDLSESDKAPQPSGWRSIMEAHAENAGFTKEREQHSKLPFVIRDALLDFTQHVRSVSAIIHLSERVRDAEQIFNHPDVKHEIVSRFGEAMHRRIRQHLIDSSMVNAVRLDTAEKLAKEFTSNISTALTQINPRSWSRQILGLVPLAHHMGPAAFAAGMEKTAASFKQAGKRMRDIRYIQQRYSHGPTSLFTADMGTEIDESVSVATAVKSLLASATHGKGRDTYAAWKELRDKVRVSNWFDGINSRVAVAGYEWQVEQEHPDWKPKQKHEWVEWMVQDAIGRTQNSWDYTEISQLHAKAKKNMLVNAVVALTSDQSKRWNIIRQAQMRGKYELGKAMVMQAVVTAGSVAVTVAWATALVQLGLWIGDRGWEEDEKDKIASDASWAFLREIGSPAMLDKVVGIVESATRGWGDDGFLANPTSDAVVDLGKGSIEMVQGVLQALGKIEYSENAMSASERFLKGMEKFALASTEAAGASLAPTYFMGRTISRTAKRTERDIMLARRRALLKEGDKEGARRLMREIDKLPKD